MVEIELKTQEIRVKVFRPGDGSASSISFLKYYLQNLPQILKTQQKIFLA